MTKLITTVQSYILFTLMIVALTSCQPEGRVYVQHQSLSSDLQWLKSDYREFSIPISDTINTYNMSLSFRFANGFQYKVVKLQVTETAPNGDQLESLYELRVADDDGEYIGEAGYDIWDTEHLIVPNKKYSSLGTYSYKIEHLMPKDTLHFAMEVGLILDEVGG